MHNQYDARMLGIEISFLPIHFQLRIAPVEELNFSIL